MSVQTSRILAVDDVPDNLFLLQAILEAEGYEVETANSGSSALAKVENSPPDLVLLDVMMPDMNGYEVAQQMRQNNRLTEIPIVMITAYEEAHVKSQLQVEASDFIRKPINIDELLTRIRAFL